ncbi:MAG: hypothetical protein E6J56_10910 [Deltaproteobacteria bacterium]|nr:MAG: hypothetical protein E6J56_10910 [Deltaproteobacteria bacterium]
MRPRQSRGGAPTAGLVLSGGGARGVFQVGVYERLLEHPRFARGPAVISGTSAGGIARCARSRVSASMRRSAGSAPPIRCAHSCGGCRAASHFARGDSSPRGSSTC